MSYNNYENWETWTVHLAVNDLIGPEVREIYAKAENKEDAIVLVHNMIENMIREWVAEEIEFTKQSLVNSFVIHSLGSVNFWELARVYVEDAEYDSL